MAARTNATGSGLTRLRVAVIVPGFPIGRDEPGLAAVVDQIERLAAVHDIHVIALRHPTPRPAYELAGTSVDALGISGRGAVGRLRVLSAGIAATVSLHRQWRLDLVHGMWADEAGAVAVAAARLIDRPSLVSVMGGELVALREIGYGAALGRGGRWTVRTALHGASTVTAGSRCLRDQIVSARPGARVELAPLGVDTTLFAPADGAARAEVPDAARVVLFVGSLEPVKDPSLMLRTFAAVATSRPDVRLRVVGHGSLGAALERQASDLAIGGSVTFSGQLPRSAMPDVYRSASVLCVTSWHEAQSMAAVEAAACAVPVVGTRVGVLPDLGDGALVVDGRHESRMATALGTVLDDPRFARETGTAARARAEQLYGIERTTARFMALYDDLAGKRRVRLQ